MGFEPDPKASTQPIKQGQGRQQRSSNPRKPNSENSNRSGSNSFGPRRPNQNNDRRSNNHSQFINKQIKNPLHQVKDFFFKINYLRFGVF
jgi:hypothetical protein